MTSIWRKANWLLENNKVEFAGSARGLIFYEVNDPEDSNHCLLQIETKDGGTHVSCSCKHGSLKWEHLCAHKLAVIIHNADRINQGGILMATTQKEVAKQM